MKVRYKGGSATLAHMGAGAEGQFGKTGEKYLFNAGQWLEVTNPADIEFYKTVSRVKGSDFEIEKPGAVADKVIETTKKVVETIKEAVKNKPVPEPKPVGPKGENKGSLNINDIKWMRGEKGGE